MAAVGFALRHDPAFKSKFLQRAADVCEDLDNFKPEIQAEHESDLRLIDADGKRLVVVEFKIKAGIDPHQDPWANGENPLETSGPFWTKGYGFKLLQNSVGCDRIWYAIIEESEGFVAQDDKTSSVKEKQFSLRRRKWLALQGASPKDESPLEKDLLDSLGEIGVTDFQERYMKAIKAGAEQIQASISGKQITEVLLWICQKLEWNPAKLDDEGRLRMRSEDDWIGVYHWKKGDSDYDYCWFGYKLSMDNEAMLAVEFGFLKGDHQARLEKFIKEFKSKWPNIQPQPSHDSRCSYFEFYRPKNSAANDLEWFKEMLKIR